MEPREPVTFAEAVLRRDRAVVLGGLGAVTLLSWVYTIRMAAVMQNGPAGPRHAPMSGADAALMFCMWAVMMTAMMTPSAASTVLTYAQIHRGARSGAAPYAPVGWFLLGYLLVWTWFSFVATLGQLWLHSSALLTPAGESLSPALSGVLLAAAGIFQWTPLKSACLKHCRSPFGFLVQNWRDGAAGALEMGIRHGAWCLGCCWFLMLLLFVLGVMNLLWMAAVTALVIVEKVAPGGHHIGRAAGVLLATWGIWTLLTL